MNNHAKHFLLIFTYWVQLSKAQNVVNNCISNTYPTFYKVQLMARDSCCIKDLHINESIAIEELQLPNFEVITLLEANLTELSPALLNRLGNLKHLTLQFGQIEKVYIDPRLESLSIRDCDVLELFIEHSDQYALQDLAIKTRRLRKLPGNLDRLNKLSTFRIFGSHIRRIDLADFKALKNLEKLSFSDGVLVELISSSRVVLPNLKYLQITGHYLTHLTLVDWDMPKLKYLDLAGNLLQQVNPILGKFPILEEIKLGWNDWDCRWVEDHARRLYDDGIKDITSEMLVAEPEDCDGTVLYGLCCDRHRDSESLREAESTRRILLDPEWPSNVPEESD